MAHWDTIWLETRRMGPGQLLCKEGSYFLDGVVSGIPELFLGIKAREVSIQPPQEHPPPPSGARNSPWAGRKLSQQEGRSLGQWVVFFGQLTKR